jgi:hypothetical protein
LCVYHKLKLMREEQPLMLMTTLEQPTGPFGRS